MNFSGMTLGVNVLGHRSTANLIMSETPKFPKPGLNVKHTGHLRHSWHILSFL
jgi:hypothetical protein